MAGIESVLKHIPHNPDDGCPWFLVVSSAKLNMLSKRIFVGPDLARCGLADNRNRSKRPRDIRFGEKSPAQQADTHRAEVIRTDVIPIHGRRIGIVRQRTILNMETALVVTAAQG